MPIFTPRVMYLPTFAGGSAVVCEVGAPTGQGANSHSSCGTTCKWPGCAQAEGMASRFIAIGVTRKFEGTSPKQVSALSLDIYITNQSTVT